MNENFKSEQLLPYHAYKTKVACARYINSMVHTEQCRKNDPKSLRFFPLLVLSFSSIFSFPVLCVFLIDFCVCTQTADEIVKYLERWKNVNKMVTSIGAEGVCHPT